MFDKFVLLVRNMQTLEQSPACLKSVPYAIKYI